MSASRDEIVISGGGVAGATLALALTRAGFPVCLLEQRALPTPSATLDIRVVALSPSAIRLFQALDVWPLPDGKVTPYQRMAVTGAANSAGIEFSARDVAQPALGYIVELRALQVALHQALQASRRCDVRIGSAIAQLETQTDRIDLELIDGARKRASLLVIAEGEFSGLREQLGIGTHGRDYESAGIVCHLETEIPNPGIAFQRFAEGGPLAFLPIADGRSSLVWTRPSTEVDALLALDEPSFAERLTEASAARFGRVRLVSARQAFPFRLALADQVSAARVVLVGDAAHKVHPLAGLGLNLGLQDVAALVDVLTEARARNRDVGGRGTLQRYQAWRQSDAECTAGLVDAMERGFRGAADSGLPGLLQTGLGWLNHLRPLKRLLTEAASGHIGRVPSLMQVALQNH